MHQHATDSSVFTISSEKNDSMLKNCNKNKLTLFLRSSELILTMHKFCTEKNALFRQKVKITTSKIFKIINCSI